MFGLATCFLPLGSPKQEVPKLQESYDSSGDRFGHACRLQGLWFSKRNPQTASNKQELWLKWMSKYVTICCFHLWNCRVEWIVMWRWRKLSGMFSTSVCTFCNSLASPLLLQQCCKATWFNLNGVVHAFKNNKAWARRRGIWWIRRTWRRDSKSSSWD